MYCTKCLRNGYQRDGGILGLCWKHSNRKCQICGIPSDGEDLCITCGKKAEIQRMYAESNHILTDPDQQELIEALRRERLQQAKFHCHRAVEVLFRGLVLSVEAIWGDVQQQKKDSPPEEFRKAA